MYEPELQDFLVLRELDDPITNEELEAADRRSTEAREELRAEGTGVVAVQSEVMKDDSGSVTGTHCHYRAENEEAIRDHAERAGLVVTRIDRRGQLFPGDEM